MDMVKVVEMERGDKIASVEMKRKSLNRYDGSINGYCVSGERRDWGHVRACAFKKVAGGRRAEGQKGRREDLTWREGQWG